jgi:hypothetical protein
VQNEKAGEASPKRLVEEVRKVTVFVLYRTATKREGDAVTPRALLCTSFITRSLTFDPSVSHVFALDRLRNTANFLHRGG